MGRFVEGEDHSQATLLPACFDDFIAEDNPIRIVDAFVSLVAAVRLKMWFRQERAEHCGPFDWAFQAHGRRAAGFAVRGRQRFDITGNIALWQRPTSFRRWPSPLGQSRFSGKWSSLRFVA